jgi:RNA polymerase sigma-70 factor (sigma-E family)
MKPNPPSTAQVSGLSDDLIDTLYRDHAARLVGLAVMLVGDRHSAEDVVQDTFIGLHRSLPRLRDRDKALQYVRAAVVNRSRSVLRARRRAALRRLPHEPPMWSAESAVIAGEDQREVLAALARLPRRAREVLALRYYLDMPDAEIAQVLGISGGTVRSTASRALAGLARHLREEQ